mgnify:CR=1 FL=1|jgi:hypothetical protein
MAINKKKIQKENLHSLFNKNLLKNKKIIKKKDFHSFSFNKKGIFYTLISLMFLSLLMFSMNIEKEYTLRERSHVIGNRIDSVNFFITDLEKDIQRGTYIAMFRSLLGIQQQITSEGQFLNDTQKTFKEIIVNGTIDGNYISVMNNTELSIWISKIQLEARKVAIEFNYNINYVKIYQLNPWVVAVDLNVTLNVTDMKNTAEWKRDQLITTTLNISTFEDPLYSVFTYGRVLNTIQKTPITDFTDGTNTTNIKEHIDNSYYIATNSSPSFIMRLSGNLSNSTNGIESIVNLKKLEDASVSIIEKSCVDYIYFSNSTPTNYLINYTYNWFRLDNESNHLGIYEAEHLI